VFGKGAAPSSNARGSGAGRDRDCRGLGTASFSGALGNCDPTGPSENRRATLNETALAKHFPADFSMSSPEGSRLQLRAPEKEAGPEPRKPTKETS
jgi:hypothetical protein